MSSVLQRWLGMVIGSSRQAAGRGSLPRARPRLELLEQRLAPALYHVNTLADLSLAAGIDPATGTIHGTNTVTLRSAIEAANLTPGGKTIDLDVSGIYGMALAPKTLNESDNLAGEFAILPVGNLAISNASGGAITVNGAGLSRVFDVNPGGADKPTTYSTVSMNGFTITDGRAFDATGANPDGLVASGGGIRDQGNVSLTLNHMVVTGNSATGDGGGVSVANVVDAPWTLTVYHSTVTENRAGDAGGGLETNGSGDVIVSHSLISGNSAVNQGAGIWLNAIGASSAILTVTDSVVSSNSAIVGPTGGIGNAGNNSFVSAKGVVGQGAVSILDSTVSNNSCGGAGGGFGDQSNLGTLVVVNSTFVGNSSAGDGGAIQEGGPSTTVNDSTITGNTAFNVGGGAFITSVAFVLNNSIVAANFSNGGAQNFTGVAPDVFGVVSAGQGNFIGQGDVRLAGIANGTGDNQIGTAAQPLDPRLGPLQNNGGPTPTEEPMPNSPVIDAGMIGVIPASAKTDQRGSPRIIDGTVDIGAVEIVFAGSHGLRR